MDRKRNGGASKAAKPTWAYAYEIVPPQTEERLHAIRTLIDAEHDVAKKKARTWRGKVVLKEEVTHILVVSDSAKQNRDINRRLEAVLKRLNVGFSLTTPMSVDDEGTEWTAPSKVLNPL
jgi:hypothetical protein